MPLFQKAVLDNYLNRLDNTKLQVLYSKYTSHFHNKDVQENLKSGKEEQYQGEFLIDLFVNILGYTKYPNPNYNLTTELKNVKDSKKADGAVLIENIAKAVIELKGTGKTNLYEIETQAFNYKYNQPGCEYIVTSNFEKLHFYIDDAVDPAKFNLFDLSFEDFKVLYLCLSYESILKGIPKLIKEESIGKEEKITKDLYIVYSLFKKDIYQNLIDLNPTIDRLELYRKTQKLLDRFLFLFFAEDRALVPVNLIRTILTDWKKLEELNEYVPLYSRFKKYFDYLNNGYKGSKYEIFAYNGGLFKQDPLLDSIIIDDHTLYKHVLKLSDYNFKDEIDVNILGHIFENSLSDIDVIKAGMENDTAEKTKSKRKNDGVFYTPKYITKYIVDSTLGKICYEKKVELQIYDDDYVNLKKRKKNETEILLNKLENYRSWLLKLTICDPSCGSGAFLNQALDFLIEEHKYIDELQAKLFGSSLVFSDFDNSILENNLFGVDINEESVEIAKLSLWLKTAKYGRKLSNLNNNIKCGNSLISNPDYSKEKAFSWINEYPEIFNNGGFDVIIGNPPYVNVELMPVLEKEYYRKTYQTFYKRGDLFSLFLDLSTNLLSNNGRISFIVPSVVLNNLSYKLIRERFLNNQWLEEVCYTGNKVFKDAIVDTVILVINKSEKAKVIKLIDAIDFYNPKHNIVPSDFFKKYDNNISIGKDDSNSITDKIYSELNIEASEHFHIFQGVVTGNNEAFIFDDLEQALSNGIEKELLFPMCHGRDIDKWYIYSKRFIAYINPEINIDNYPGAKKWLEKFQTELKERRECKNGVIPWSSLQWPREKVDFLNKPKILIQNTRNERLQPRIIATIDNEGLFGTQGLNFILSKSDIDIYNFLGLLNSKLINYLFTTKLMNLAIKADYIKKLKFPVGLTDSKIGLLAKQIGIYNTELYELSKRFQRQIQRKFNLEKLSNKMQDWYLHDYAIFIKELAKKKISLSPKDESEWENYFLEESKNAIILKDKIEVSNKELDHLVYNLYGLAPEEILLLSSF